MSRLEKYVFEGFKDSYAWRQYFRALAISLQGDGEEQGDFEQSLGKRILADDGEPTVFDYVDDGSTTQIDGDDYVLVRALPHTVLEFEEGAFESAIESGDLPDVCTTTWEPLLEGDDGDGEGSYLDEVEFLDLLDAVPEDSCGTDKVVCIDTQRQVQFYGCQVSQDNHYFSDKAVPVEGRLYIKRRNDSVKWTWLVADEGSCLALEKVSSLADMLVSDYGAYPALFLKRKRSSAYLFKEMMDRLGVGYSLYLTLDQETEFFVPQVLELLARVEEAGEGRYMYYYYSKLPLSLLDKVSLDEHGVRYSILSLSETMLELDYDIGDPAELEQRFRIWGILRCEQDYSPTYGEVPVAVSVLLGDSEYSTDLVGVVRRFLDRERPLRLGDGGVIYSLIGVAGVIKLDAVVGFSYDPLIQALLLNTELEMYESVSELGLGWVLSASTPLWVGTKSCEQWSYSVKAIEAVATDKAESGAVFALSDSDILLAVDVEGDAVVVPSDVSSNKIEALYVYHTVRNGDYAVKRYRITLDGLDSEGVVVCSSTVDVLVEAWNPDIGIISPREGITAGDKEGVLPEMKATDVIGVGDTVIFTDEECMVLNAVTLSAPSQSVDQPFDDSWYTGSDTHTSTTSGGYITQPDDYIKEVRQQTSGWSDYVTYTIYKGCILWRRTGRVSDSTLTATLKIYTYYGVIMEATCYIEPYREETFELGTEGQLTQLLNMSGEGATVSVSVVSNDDSVSWVLHIEGEDT